GCTAKRSVRRGSRYSRTEFPKGLINEACGELTALPYTKYNPIYMRGATRSGSVGADLRVCPMRGATRSGSVGADLRVCPEAVGSRNRGRHAGLPLRYPVFNPHLGVPSI